MQIGRQGRGDAMKAECAGQWGRPFRVATPNCVEEYFWGSGGVGCWWMGVGGRLGEVRGVPQGA